ncbi:hypothetical protein TNCT_683771 [Trichonephila clavata]|uniref:Uncharacterized protein n=1 Tax=Trichonephila clavata TaxID=2740835 RepID=A0A8X6KES9_TRICU|nr:hypothetical protein TNCT_683771 [Trichonephila clavata]
MEDAKTIIQEFLKLESIRIEDFDLLKVADGVTVARARLRDRLDILDNCAANLHVLICCSRQELITIMKGITSPADLRSQIQKYLTDAVYIIGIIQRNLHYLTGRVSHPELLPAARDDFNRMKSNYLLLENDIILFLDYLEHKYRNDYCNDEIAFLLAA